MKDLALLIMAAGMGSRFGGLKQLQSVGPNGALLMDYSLADAAKAGFAKVVFVIRPEMEKDFRQIVLPRVPAAMEVSLVFQEKTDLPGQSPPGFDVSGRDKPWGTGQAVWAARKVLVDPFMVLNADDYYGVSVFAKMAEALRGGGPGKYFLAGYRLARTLSPNGGVSRGVCEVDPDSHRLLRVVEYRGLARQDDGTIREEGSGQSFPDQSLVSMNAWGCQPDIFPLLEARFVHFLKNWQSAGGGSGEFYLPSAIQAGIETGHCLVQVVPLEDEWIGVTYPQDLDPARERLREIREPLPHLIKGKK
ncbi:MAG: NTP transferase domain-containing protein [Opitutales bacterium]|nr:NTP transferase domain-containing protein [Opitutales bacterium]MCH8540935.1 NTP transferase domain-containing protein [Opitutales bacterium]